MKLGYAVSIAAWSLAAAAHALVGSVRGFMIARVALGLGEGGNFPSSIKAVALWFPEARARVRDRAVQLGRRTSARSSRPRSFPSIAAAWGWRAAFVIMGVVGLLWLLLWLPFYDDPEKIEAADARRAGAHPLRRRREDAGEGKPIGWGVLLGYRQAWSFIVAKLLTDPVWWFFLIWLPDYFKKKWALDIKKSWVHLVTIYAIITVLSIVGRLADRLPRAPRLERHARAQDRDVHLRVLRAADLLRDARRSRGRRWC